MDIKTGCEQDSAHKEESTNRVNALANDYKRPIGISSAKYSNAKDHCDVFEHKYKASEYKCANITNECNQLRMQLKQFQRKYDKDIEDRDIKITDLENKLEYFQLSDIEETDYDINHDKDMKIIDLKYKPLSDIEEETDYDSDYDSDYFMDLYEQFG